MYKFFRDNQKRLLAFFGVILMIAFVMPSASKNFNDNSDPPLGKIGNDRILMSSIRNAEDEWNFLQRNVVYQQMDQSLGKAQYLPVTAVLGEEFQQTMQENPEAYYLLLYEAQKMGLVPKYDDADRAMTDDVVAFRDVDGTVKSAANLNDRARPEHAREALGNLLMVRDAFMRASRAIKLSEPLMKHNVAQQAQQIKVRVADFMMRDYESAVGTPTEDQLKKQFDTYADTLDTAGPTEANPFGFGYKFPNRVKLQYIEIPRAEVRKTVKAQMNDYQWDVEANAYYLKHQGEFIGTTTAPSDPLSLAPSSTTKISTTKPISEVKDQIITQLVERRADTLQTQIQNDLVAIMSRDYENWLKANPNGPTTSTAATTGPADGFESYAYLQKLAQDILKRHNVTLTVASITDSFKSSKELDALPGIGKTQQFGDIAVILAEPFVTGADKSRPGVLSLFKPSAVRQDDESNRYFFRLTATEASHKPASLAEVKDQVEQDWKKTKSLELAKADAQKLLEVAKTTELEKAATDRKVIQTGEFSAGMPTIDNYSLTSRGTQQFVTKCYDMLQDLANKTTNRPVTLIELPIDQRVVVAELVFVDSFVKPEIEQLIAVQMEGRFHQQIQMEMSRLWFDYDSIVQRLGYVDLTRKPKAQQSAAQ